jgi:2-polyprenyl-3-methyl-5-hydroxy-6-metoxy-1,4-benzoquinol methylase
MAKKIKFILPPKDMFKPNGKDDPLPYYYKPCVGWLYRKRIQAGLDLLSGRYGQVMEFGYGSGLLLPTLSKLTDKLYAVDLKTDPLPIRDILFEHKISAVVLNGDIVQIDLPAGQFDLIVAFSVFEHIADPLAILQRMHALLRPGGQLLVGMPRVDKFMESIFPLIGYPDIGAHHVKDVVGFIKDAQPWFSICRKKQMPEGFPCGCGLYFNILFNRRS